MNNAEFHLTEHGIKPTAVRILIWQKIADQTETFTLSDMQNQLPYMDKSSIFRTLRLFKEHHLLHEVADGTGQQKYCVCRCCNDDHFNHPHFYCYKCKKTYCLEDIFVPELKLPANFQINEIEYIIKGICNNCS